VTIPPDQPSCAQRTSSSKDEILCSENSNVLEEPEAASGNDDNQSFHSTQSELSMADPADRKQPSGKQIAEDQSSSSKFSNSMTTVPSPVSIPVQGMGGKEGNGDSNKETTTGDKHGSNLKLFINSNNSTSMAPVPVKAPTMAMALIPATEGDNFTAMMTGPTSGEKNRSIGKTQETKIIAVSTEFPTNSSTMMVTTGSNNPMNLNNSTAMAPAPKGHSDGSTSKGNVENTKGHVSTEGGNSKSNSAASNSNNSRTMTSTSSPVSASGTEGVGARWKTVEAKPSRKKQKKLAFTNIPRESVDSKSGPMAVDQGIDDRGAGDKSKTIVVTPPQGATKKRKSLQDDKAVGQGEGVVGMEEPLKIAAGWQTKVRKDL
jgi:hypothetical protein